MLRLAQPLRVVPGSTVAFRVSLIDGPDPGVLFATSDMRCGNVVDVTQKYRPRGQFESARKVF